MDFVKALLFIIGAFIMAVCLVFVPEISGSVSVAFTALISIYLGLDIASMITRTSQMKVGEFKELKTHKYVISAICLVALIIICIIKKEYEQTATSLASFLTASMIIISCLIGGLEGNKIATGVKNE